jgi:hypothetical protein
MIKQAIQKAIEGGWKHKWSEEYNNTVCNINSLLEPSFLLDPNFWQALGKSEGWWDNRGFDADMNSSWNLDECHRNMHQFLDHLIEGKDIDSYFKELLK